MVPIMFTHDIFYEFVVPILEQTIIYTQSTHIEQRIDQLSLI